MIIVFFVLLLVNTNCCIIRTLTYKLYPKFGFANELSFVIFAASYARQTDRIFLIDSSIWNYGNFADYFVITEPLGKYRKYFVNSKKIEANFNAQAENHICHLETTRGMPIWNWKSFFSTSFWDEEKRAMAKKYLRLTQSAKKKILKILKNSGMNSLQFKPDLAFHIRRGDKITEAKRIPVIKFLKAAHKYVKTNDIFKKNKIDNKKRKLRVFVASDDKKIAAEIAAVRRTWQVYYIKDSLHLTDSGHDQETFNRLPWKDRTNEALKFLADMTLLVNSEYFICGFSSSVARLIYTLRDNPNTSLSLDRPWYIE